MTVRGQEAGGPRARGAPASVLIVHNRYRQAGGEDTVVAAERGLLASRGHRVELLEVDNNDLPDPSGIVGRVRLARETIWSEGAARRVASAAKAVHADVVHIHNFLPQLSPAIHGASRATGAAVVQTLHRYRLVCPAATLLRDGHICEDCRGLPVAAPAVVHGCYRDSRAQSAVVSAMLAVHRLRHTWTRDVDAFIALTPFMSRIVADGGLPRRRIHVKPNFVDRATARVDTAIAERTGVLFVGRLSPEKGLATLLAAWRLASLPTTLRIVGGGQLEPEAAALAAVDTSVTVVGEASRERVVEEMSRAAILVVPSLWYEGAPLVIVEAFAAGLPVVASDLGPMRDMIDEGRTGRLSTAGDPTALASVLRDMTSDAATLRAMGGAARVEYETRYTADANYPLLLDIYGSAIAHRRSERSRG